MDAIPDDDLVRLERVAARIRAFAEAQRDALRDVEAAIPGGRTGHRVSPVARAGCYAPGGRYPLPSSVLMTAVTARVAGVPSVWIASPKPSPVTLAAAAVAGADAVLAAGGAHAVAALAYGAGPVPACDVVVGPGNAYVTAAKRLVRAHVRIDSWPALPSWWCLPTNRRIPRWSRPTSSRRPSTIPMRCRYWSRPMRSWSPP